MHQARRVGGREPLADLHDDIERPPVPGPPGGRQALRPLLEVLALDVLHGHERAPRHLADVVDAHDVRMVELGQRLGLAREAGPLRLVVVDDLLEQLEGDAPVELRVVGAKHGAHAPLAQLVDHHESADANGIHIAPEQLLFEGATQALRVEAETLGRALGLAHLNILTRV